MFDKLFAKKEKKKGTQDAFIPIFYDESVEQKENPMAVSKFAKTQPTTAPQKKVEQKENPFPFAQETVQKEEVQPVEEIVEQEVEDVSKTLKIYLEKEITIPVVVLASQEPAYDQTLRKAVLHNEILIFGSVRVVGSKVLCWEFI